MKLKFRLLIPMVMFGIIFLIFFLPDKFVYAASQKQLDCNVEYVWRQINSGQFIVLFTASQVSLAEEISENYISTIENEFLKYSTAFSSGIPTPITIRIYPSRNEYFCLNALAPMIGPDDSHSHIGTREIALIADVIDRSPMTWETQAMNALRHEIAILFAENISDGKAPPGLLMGLGSYFQNPQETFLTLWQTTGEINLPDRGWQRLWEEDIPASNALVFLQQTSTVAYLIDLFGWEKFNSFLQSIAEYQGYRQALVEVYGVNLQDLQTHWMQYFPVYVQGRWQANVIHSFDLSQYSQLISEGAYADAAERLYEAISMIELFGDNDRLSEARSLLEKAQKGSEASGLALEARQAILALDYGLGYSKAEQALAIYHELDDPRRVSEVEAYRNLCAEVLTLRDDLSRLRGRGTPLDPVRTQKIVSIGRRLNDLGDSVGANQVQIALLLLGSGQQVFIQWVTVIGLLACIYLIWRRIVHVRKDLDSKVHLL